VEIDLGLRLLENSQQIIAHHHQMTSAKQVKRVADVETRAGSSFVSSADCPLRAIAPKALTTTMVASS
jgi:hypothetical protein